MTPWDPEVLARIDQLHLKARTLVAGFLHGGHRSLRVASNVEFADYKEYSPGDPLRDLDWRVAARTDRLVVRRHQAETELAATLVVDASADTGTGELGRRTGRGLPDLEGTKWGYTAVLAATLAWWLHRRNEPVGIAILGGEGVPWRWIPPRSGTNHLTQIFGALAQTRPAGRAELGEGLRLVGGRLRRRSLAVLVSDLMEEPAEWGPTLATILGRRVDLRVVHLHDSREWALDYREPARFLSLEDGDSLPIDPRSARGPMGEVVGEYLAEVRGWLGAHQASHHLVATDRPMEEALTHLLRGI